MSEKTRRSPAKAAVEEPTTTLSIADIKELFVLMKQNEIAELNLENKDTKIHIVSTRAPQVVHAAPQVMPMVAPQVGMIGMPQHAPSSAPAESGTQSVPATETSAAAEPAVPSNLKTVTSPIVGTFYRAPAPDAPAFVKVGDVVGDETVLCIIEAMKLMNEIKAEMKGRIQKFLVENGNPVEYNQPLFLIEPV